MQMAAFFYLYLMNKQLLFFWLLCASPILAFGQLDWTTISIGSSGSTLYVPGNLIQDSSYSEDSSLVISGELAIDSFHFFIICVEIKNPLPDSASLQETLLINYLDYLKFNFSITSSTGYATGQQLPDNATAVGVLDYWQDEFGDNWSIKGWTNGEILAVLGVYGPSPYPDPTSESLYLNGFRFPKK